MNRTIALFGSSRRNGNTGQFIDWIAGELAIDVIDLADKDISAFDYEHKNAGDDFAPLLKQLLEYDSIIFVTPIYWYGPSAQLKVFIDRLSDLLDVEELKDYGRQLRNKTGFIVCTSSCSDADSTFLNSFINTFEYLGMQYGGYVHADCENGYVQKHYQEDVEKFKNIILGA